MIESAQQIEPFFTNDAAGYARIVFAYCMGMGPLFGLVVWFLRRGPEQLIDGQERDLNSLGEKVNRMSEEQERDREDRLALRREIVANQREVIDRIVDGNRTIQDQLQKGDVRMARVEERCDIAGSFERLGERIENAVALAAAKRT